MNDFEKLKTQSNLLEYIVKRTGYTFKNIGQNTIDLSECPFCEGHDCFRIFPSEQSYKCFQCKDSPSGGDIYDFIQRKDNCGKHEALKTLASFQGYELEEKQGKQLSPCEIEAQKRVKTKTAIFEAAALYYQASMHSNTQAFEYQCNIRQHDEKTLDSFGVGFSDGKLHQHLANKGFATEDLLDSGIICQDTNRTYDFFGFNNFIYPHRDLSGSIVGFTIKPLNKTGHPFKLPHKYWINDGAPFHNMAPFKGNKIILVEGENDLLSVYGRGEQHTVVSINGSLSKTQIEYLVAWAPGKTIYLCFDNDEAGRRYTKTICEALQKECLPPTLAEILHANPVELRLIHFNPDKKDIDDYLKELSDSKKIMEALLQSATRYYPPLIEIKNIYLTWVNDPSQERKFNYDTLGRICFDWFHGEGTFFVTGNVCKLYFRGKIYLVASSDPDWKALLYDYIELNAAQPGAKMFFQSIESLALLRGDKTSDHGWLFTDKKADSIYFNLCNEYHQLIKLSPNNIELITNGTNTGRVLLQNPPRMVPLKYLSTMTVEQGMALLKSLIFDNMPCDLPDRYLLICQIINTVLLQYSKAKGIFKHSGSPGGGKTSATALISALIYGEDTVSTGSVAANYSEAAQSPYCILDNLEQKNRNKEAIQFLLTVSTGSSKIKRKGGTDTENVYEKANTQIAITSVEPVVEQELIERTLELLFDKDHYQNPNYMERSETEANIVKHRDEIWSAIFKMVANNILPCLSERRKQVLEMLNRDYPKHSKQRLNEFFSMFVIILQEVTTYIKAPEQEPLTWEQILRLWIQDQNQRAASTAEDDNMVLHALEMLLSEYEATSLDWFESNYRLKVEQFASKDGSEGYIKFRMSTKKFSAALHYLNRERGIKINFDSTGQLWSRIVAAEDILNKNGWFLERKVVTIKGTDHHRFTKKYPLFPEQGKEDIPKETRK